MAGQNKQAAFTYDFGISIATSTVAKVAKLAGASLTLAAAFNALRETAKEYVSTLKENILQFGGMTQTMTAMAQAQDRLVKGISFFTSKDQLNGMRQLQNTGIDVAKNYEWISKSAHAMGQNFSEFSGAITSAINGNMGALVDMGLLTQRAAKMFDKYEAGTVMRQQAILNFMKTHKGLMNAVKDDFYTIQDQMMRIKGVWKTFLTTLVGNPKDPSSFYGQIASSTKAVADALARNMNTIKKYATIIGQILGYIFKQIGKVVLWLGRQVKNVLGRIKLFTDNYVEELRSFFVWLEFWRVKVVKFFKEYSKQIKTVLKLMLLLWATNKLLDSGFRGWHKMSKGVKGYRNELFKAFTLHGRYYRMLQKPGLLGRMQALAAFMPRGFRKAWVAAGRFMSRFFGNMGFFLRSLPGKFTRFFGLISKGFKILFAVIRLGIKSIPIVGWIIALIGLVVLLYQKCERFRKVVNRVLTYIVAFYQTAWNLLNALWAFIWGNLKKFGSFIGGWISRIWNAIIGGIKAGWETIKGFFSMIFNWISETFAPVINVMKNVFSAIGDFLDPVIDKVKSLFEWFGKVWDTIKSVGSTIGKWIGKAWDFIASGDAAKSAVEWSAQAAANAGAANNVQTLASGSYVQVGGENFAGKIKDSTKNGENIFSKKESSNPLLPETSYTSMGSDTTGDTNMNFNNGAIQIVLNKADGIDEQKLAEKVKSVILDMKRTEAVRGGMV